MRGVSGVLGRLGPGRSRLAIDIVVLLAPGPFLAPFLPIFTDNLLHAWLKPLQRSGKEVSGTPTYLAKGVALCTPLVQVRATHCDCSHLYKRRKRSLDQSLGNDVPVCPVEELFLHVVVQARPWWMWWMLIVEDELGCSTLSRF